ncbi:hypothetical protein B0H21DRAFT_458556 [Amylocystis lapponica]|nr:hypothetical protein B0H21DRAFT_458556 [Amylocystis lapponica]
MSTLDCSSSRLPSYKAAHLGRYHPYPRISRRNDRHEDDALRRTCGESDVNGSRGSPSPNPPPAVYLGPVYRIQNEPDGDVSILELDGRPSEQGHPKKEQGAEQLSKLPAFINFIVLSVVRRYNAVRSGRIKSPSSN